jgi:hypothetical protein
MCAVELTMHIMSSGGTFSFLELLDPSEFMCMSDDELNFLLGLRTLSAGFGFFGCSSSNEMTKPFEASVSSLSRSVFMAASVSASSSVSCVTPELERSEEGPEPASPPEERLKRRGKLAHENAVVRNSQINDVLE